MNNTEHIEAQLTALDNKPVIVIQPSYGTISYSYIGNLMVIKKEDPHHVSFHISHPSGVVAIIFRAEDVVKLEEPGGTIVEKIIRLNGPQMYNDKYERTIS